MLAVLQQHCEAEGRDYAAIEKTSMLNFAGDVDKTIGQLHWLAGMGIQSVFLGVADVYTLGPLRTIGQRIIPAVAAL